MKKYSHDQDNLMKQTEILDQIKKDFPDGVIYIRPYHLMKLSNFRISDKDGYLKSEMVVCDVVEVYETVTATGAEENTLTHYTAHTFESFKYILSKPQNLITAETFERVFKNVTEKLKNLIDEPKK